MSAARIKNAPRKAAPKKAAAGVAAGRSLSKAAPKKAAAKKPARSPAGGRAAFASLEKTANRLRVDALEMVERAQSGHPGGSLSCLDILTALFFGGLLRHRPKQPAWPGRDYFFCSKGHATPAVYAALSARGFFPKKHFAGFRKVSSLLQGHVSVAVPGVELSGGSLGQGLSAAAGVAAGLALSGKTNRVFCLLGDGELQEGQVWEAAMTAAKYNLANLTAIVDANQLQIDGAVSEVMPVASIAEKFRAFGWKAVEADGHSFASIFRALARSPGAPPTVAIFKTIKGKGLPPIEGVVDFHGKPVGPAFLAEARAKLLA